MDTVQFFQIVAAVCFGNFLSAAFYWGAVRATREQAAGATSTDLPFKVLAALAVPPSFVAAMIWVTT